MKNDGVHDGHRRRMREKYLDNGISSLQDHEILEMLLYNVIPVKNMNVPAHDMLKSAGSLENILSGTSFADVNGIGQNTEDFFSVISSAVERFLEDGALPIILDSEKDFLSYLRSCLGSETDSGCLIVSMNNAGNPIDREWIAYSKKPDDLRPAASSVMDLRAERVLICMNIAEEDDPETIYRYFSEAVVSVCSSADIDIADMVIRSNDNFYSINKR